MGIRANIRITVEGSCPRCNYWNRYHELSAVHGNTANWLEKRLEGREPIPLQVKCRCDSCGNYFDISDMRVVKSE
jgi:hypothetical protein